MFQLPDHWPHLKILKQCPFTNDKRPGFNGHPSFERPAGMMLASFLV
jgi:hypothetical protein